MKIFKKVKRKILELRYRRYCKLWWKAHANVIKHKDDANDRKLKYWLDRALQYHYKTMDILECFTFEI